MRGDDACKKECSATFLLRSVFPRIIRCDRSARCLLPRQNSFRKSDPSDQLLVARVGP